jgi:hypothetical protein
MALQTPIINGRRYGFSSIDLAVNGLPVLGRSFTGLSYSDTVQRGEVRGGSPLPLGHTRGDYSAEGSLEMPKEEFDIFLSAITLGGTLGYYEASFELTASYSEFLSPGTPLMVDHLNGCKLNGTAQDYQRGPEGLIVRVPLYVHYLILNGKMPYGPDVLVR